MIPMSVSDYAVIRAMVERVEQARKHEAEVQRRMNDILDAACDKDRFQEHDLRAYHDTHREFQEAGHQKAMALEAYYTVSMAALEGVRGANLLALATKFSQDDDETITTTVVVAPANDKPVIDWKNHKKAQAKWNRERNAANGDK